MKAIVRLLLILTLIPGGAVPVAEAVLFTFDDPALYGSATTQNGAKSSGVNSAKPGSTDPIEAYMEAVWQSVVGDLNDITVKWGARTRRGRIEDVFTTVYLGNSDGATSWNQTGSPPEHTRNAQYYTPGGTPPAPTDDDVYLYNRWNASLPGNCGTDGACQRDRITVVFEEAPIGAVAFDWEIFPVTNGANDVADFTFFALDVNGQVINLVNTPSDGPATFYRESLPICTDDGPRPCKKTGDVGHFSMTFDVPVKTLIFKDWNTAPIGIDNLQVDVPIPPQVVTPEPGTLLLLGSGLVAAGAAVRRKRRRGAATDPAPTP